MSIEFSKTEKEPSSVGKRLVDAFAAKGIENKKDIARLLGFHSDKAIYKVINGSQELSFDALRAFADETGFSIHWLLTNELPRSCEPNELILELVNESLANEMEACWRVQAVREKKTYWEYVEGLIRAGLKLRRDADFEAQLAHDPLAMVREGADALRKTFENVVNESLNRLYRIL